MAENKVLIVDDDEGLRKELKTALSGYLCVEAADGEEALKKIESESPHLVLLDLQMPRVDGLEVLKETRLKHEDIPVIITTAFGDMDIAVNAMKLGAYDFLSKPIELEKLKVAVKNALEKRGLVQEVASLKQDLKERYRFENIIGGGGRMQEVFKMMEKVIGSDVSVLLLGESGTGKEQVARALHYNGPRKDRPLIAVHCAAIPETLIESELFGHEKGAFTGATESRAGKFEQADGGTLFLDEVGEIKPSTQVKLLRVLQEREFERVGGAKKIKVDVRIISATQRNLIEEIKKGNFREDLYYRIAVVSLPLPPLRERREDIPRLISCFLDKFNKKSDKKIAKISKEVMSLFNRYPWPGNVRELENAIDRAVVFAPGDTLTPECLEPGLKAAAEAAPEKEAGGIKPLSEVEREVISEALKAAGGNISQAAKGLKIGRATLYRKAKKFGLA